MNVKRQIKHKDKYCTEFTIKQIAEVKKFFGISNSKRVYTLDRWCSREYFLCEDKVYVVNFKYKDELRIISAYVVTLNNSDNIDFEVIIPDNTTPKYKEFNGLKINLTRKIYTKEDFLEWYNSPCCVNEFVDVPHRKAVKFLQNYNKNTFNQDRYLFYAKRDDDLTWLYFIYAYDTKTSAELKIYADFYIDTKFPEKLSEIYVKDLSGKLSDYQKLQCKKAFFEYSKQECVELKAPNFYALEFVKQCIQPIEKDRGWFVDRPFLCGSEFDNIWIDDVLRYDEKPYFLVCNNNQRSITKIAAIDFLKPEYKSTEPYINAYMKRNHWNIDKATLKRLVKFLNEPFDSSKMGYESEDDKKKIKTNWQRLIDDYNYNTAQYKEEYITLPKDLPMPDYTKLLKDK